MLSNLPIYKDIEPSEDIFKKILKNNASYIEEILLAFDIIYFNRKIIFLGNEELKKYPLLKYLIDNFENILLKSYAKITILLSQEILKPIMRKSIKLNDQVIEEMKDEIKKLDIDLYSLLFYIALRKAYRLKSENLSLLAKLSDTIANIINGKNEFKPILAGIYFYMYLYSKKEVYKEVFESSLNEIIERYKKNNITYVQACKLLNVLYDIYEDIPNNIKFLFNKMIKLSLINVATYVYNNYSRYVQEIITHHYHLENLVKEFYEEDAIYCWTMPTITEIYYIVRARKNIEINSLILPCVNPLENISKEFMIPLSFLKILLQLKYYSFLLALFILRRLKNIVSISLSVVITILLIMLVSLIINISSPITSIISIMGGSSIYLLFDKIIINKIIDRISEKCNKTLTRKIVDKGKKFIEKTEEKINFINTILKGIYLIK